MPKYLYIFTYQTPEQRAIAGSTPENAEESSRALFISAASPEEALAWGAEVAEAFVASLFGNVPISWKSLNYAQWLEAQPESEYPKAILAALPAVEHGALPDFDKLRG